MKQDKKTIIDFDAKISVALPLDIKTPKEYLSEDDYKLVTEIFTTTAKYKGTGWVSDIPVSEMQSDVIQLQSLQMEITIRFASLMSYTESVEDQLKIVRSKIRMNCKSLKKDFEDEGNLVAITAEDVKDLSYSKTEDIWKKLQDAKIAADFVKFVYYAARDHIALLDKAIQRINRFE